MTISKCSVAQPGAAAFAARPRRRQALAVVRRVVGPGGDPPAPIRWRRSQRSLGDPRSPVHVRCEVTADGYQLPASLPTIPTRIGIDRDPPDVTDDDDRRWLLACVWPDTGRLDRMAEALRIAALSPPDVRQGDMVAELASTIDTVAVDGTICVMTSWAAAYLSPPARDDFAAVLAEIGRHRPVVWLSLEMSGVVDMLDAPADVGSFEIEPCVVGLTRFHDGTRTARVLGLVHPHGRTLHWL